MPALSNEERRVRRAEYMREYQQRNKEKIQARMLEYQQKERDQGPKT